MPERRKQQYSFTIGNSPFLVCEDDLGRVCQIDVRDRRMNRQDDFENDEITYIISFFDLMI